MNSIGKKIEHLMKSYTISYGEISEGTGIPKSAIHRYVTGETEKIPINRVVDIAKYLHVTPEYLLDWDDLKEDYVQEFHNKGYKYNESMLAEGYSIDEIARLVMEKENKDAITNPIYADCCINDDELLHLKKYRSLDNRGKKNVDVLLENEYKYIIELQRRTEMERSLDVSMPTTYSKTEYLTGLSAGGGLFVFDDIPTQIIAVPEKYKDADFVISVSGNSMEATYHNGDKVAVKKMNNINVGEIGVFMINGNGYIKELGDGVLISHNKEYRNISIDETTICIGKVLGKL